MTTSKTRREAEAARFQAWISGHKSPLRVGTAYDLVIRMGTDPSPPELRHVTAGKRFVQSRPLILTSLDTLIELGVSSNRYAFGATTHARSLNTPPFMKIHKLKAALSKAQAQVAKTEKAAKAAAALAMTLKANMREAKIAFRQSRRRFKQTRRFLKTATRDQKEAENALKKATARFEQVRAKMT